MLCFLVNPWLQTGQKYFFNTFLALLFFVLFTLLFEVSVFDLLVGLVEVLGSLEDGRLGDRDSLPSRFTLETRTDPDFEFELEESADSCCGSSVTFPISFDITRH